MTRKVIIWDLDGTLMDTLQDLFLATNHALRAFGMPERTLDKVRCFVGNGVRRLIQLAIPDGEDNPRFEDVFKEFKAYYVEHCRDNTDLYPGITETLQALKEAGCRMAVVSNKLQSGVDELHKEYFSQYIDVAIGERQGINRKPAPDMVLLALQELAASKEEAIYIGDSDVDIQTAKNAGLPCISVLWGFRDKDFLTAHGATTFAQQPKDIVDKLTN